MIIATILVRDEEDILEYTIENIIRQGVGIIVATDNGSKDDSRKILEKYKQVKVIIDEPLFNHDQRAWVTRMAKIAVNYNPDWIVHIDSDELWVGLNKLVYEDHQGYLKIPAIYQHPPVSHKDWNLELNKHCLKLGSLVGLSNTMPKVIHRSSKYVVIGNGNHTVSGCGEEKIIDYVEIHHYPVRTYNQFTRKVVQGAMAILSQTDSAKSDAGNHWMQWYDSFNNNELPLVFENICSKCNVLINRGDMNVWK